MAMSPQMSLLGRPYSEVAACKASFAMIRNTNPGRECSQHDLSSAEWRRDRESMSVGHM